MSPAELGRLAAKGESAQVRALTLAHLGKRGTPAAEAFLRNAQDLLAHWALEGGDVLEGQALQESFDAYLFELTAEVKRLSEPPHL